jgi:Holliday junction DNA helicase RuvA
MIGLLRGAVLARSPERVLLDVGGVGYEVWVPLSTFSELQRLPEGATARLHVHTHLREDALTLYGFWTEREKALFERLIGVAGIGPRLARVILSGLAPADLVAALAAGDALRLATIPGVGRKTAERMVLELRDKVADLAAAEPAAAPGPGAPPADEDLVSALVNLGYKRAPAERAVVEARRERPEADFPALLRASLQRLSRA